MSNVPMQKRAWKPLTDVELRKAVEQRVKTSVELLRDAATVKERAIQEPVDFQGMILPQWSDLSLADGYPGLCLLFGELDRLEPEAGWDMAGHQMLVAVQQSVTQTGISAFNLWGGLAGVMMGIRALSRGGTRYAGMLASFNEYAAKQLPTLINEWTARMETDLRMTDYDLMGGITGIGRYLLAFKDEPNLQPALQSVLHYLISLSGDKELDGQNVPLWHITRTNQFLPSEREQYQQGNFNLGLSHGVAGPMGLLALAKLHGVEVAGQEAAIRRYAEWLCEWMLEDEAGSYWPGRIPMEVLLDGWGEATVPSHESWCYGASGISRQLWFAGVALGETKWKEIAVEAALASLRRPTETRGVAAPNFCHGLAGLAHAANVMYAETGNEVFAQERDRLVAQVLDLYDEELPFGVYELHRVEVGHQQLSKPGLLIGLAGTLVVLASMLAEEAPEWDAVFLMS
ncbi:lanthionine synthetase C family protein [Tumebacillus permanentifrigoris]|uniref:Lanthionine synthetase-like protein n=1 Tax=Tumebacillus permanentifrigoris TaxID=378543 RepID=A0A316DDZ1_9BACL|nr:lanthionine synthetase C family protein [Tumebacillus permanentifrigoris]PWK15010.1 lanthionine synthetase-like protein [Tumebacillus permanentifrigoris]